MTAEVTKMEIFALFYGIAPKTRAGGGKLKNKMTRKNASLETCTAMLMRIKKHSPELEDYYHKLCNRSPSIAPPPPPK